MRTHKVRRATAWFTAALAVMLTAPLGAARADVKNVWIGVNGAT